MFYKPEYLFTRLISEDEDFEPLPLNRNRVCKHLPVLDGVDGDTVCVRCFQILKFSTDTFQKEATYVRKKKVQAQLPIWRRDHDRNRWNTYVLEYLKGTYQNELNPQCWDFLCQEVPECFLWYDVAKIFHHYKLGDFWISFGTYIGYPPKLNSAVVYYANKYTNTKKGKYRVNYLYLLYKFTQLFGEDPHDARFIPLKGKLVWIYHMDLWWKKFCAKEWFEFKPTLVYKLKWNKRAKLKNLKV